tara:strand:- start:130 stop:588 length:459 start_codon:yes stop_codon:yes gene_type:complete
MSNKGHVYLRINKNYVATVRDLNSLASYLEKVGDMDDSFGEIVEISKFSELRLYKLHTIINKFKAIQNKKSIGNHLQVFRNQGFRDGVVVATSKNGFLVEYEMPNGSTALNVITSLSRPDNYKTMTYKRAFGSWEFGLQLQDAQLINNPQIH